LREIAKKVMKNLVEVSEIAESESDLRITKFQIADPMWNGRGKEQDIDSHCLLFRKLWNQIS